MGVKFGDIILQPVFPPRNLFISLSLSHKLNFGALFFNSTKIDRPRLASFPRDPMNGDYDFILNFHTALIFDDILSNTLSILLRNTVDLKCILPKKKIARCD